MLTIRRVFDLRFWIVGLLLLTWLAVSGLILIGRGDVESVLQAAFGRHARPDAFEFLNRIFPLIWTCHSLLCSLVILAVRNRRNDIVLILMIGPAIAFLLCLAGQDWSDPNWFVVLAICCISWLVSTLVAGCYWMTNPKIR